MKQKEIIEGNCKIADFMDGEKHWLFGGNEPYTNDSVWGYYNIGSNVQSTYSGRSIALVNDLKYHTSWDWLMPVVEKIEQKIIKVNITTNCIIFRVDGERDNDIVILYKANKQTKLEGCWLAVIEFINWYNSHHI